MKDESSEDDSDVGCPYCESGSGCDHLLLFFDATDGRADGGVVDPYDFDEIVAKAFVKVLKEGTDLNWHDWRITELFEQIDDEWAATMLTATTPELLESLPIDFVFELLDEAGGAEQPGSLFDQSGGYCESAVRVSYAKDPVATFEKAKHLLEDRLENDIHPPPKRRRRKRGEA